MVKFQYNPQKCYLPHAPSENRPTKCLKCLDLCPHSLLMFKPTKEKSGDGAPIRYEIYLTFKAYANKYCPQCLKCAENCPNQAIKISI
ncbi:MAG: 4Fe-4S dicluster domain-containing protein [Candidatus Jordarchaeaceae archaeon]